MERGRERQHAGQYVAAYRRVVGTFRAAGVTTVTWVWSPKVAYPGSVPIARLFAGAAVWFNHDKKADWRVQSSDGSRIAYAAGVAAGRYA